ncbi:hypothetical protein HJA95_07555 [Rhizobium binae]|uniref:hypothetical protein n=1 Tax=Rhizobium binae TaxID=1138190 RepID=UPI001C82F0CA|nr:hypothetical protein [Rhizobium binae]MBX4949446.1 hypothetical protein [Rhizobium binae]
MFIFATSMEGGKIDITAANVIDRLSPCWKQSWRYSFSVNHREEAAADGAADAVEARTLDAFRAMAADQRRKMLIRCVDISSGSAD